MRLYAGTLAIVVASAAIAAAQPARDFKVSLSTTMCFGACPVYEVSVDGNGNVVYVGTENVRVKGRRTSTVPLSAVAKLAAESEAIGFFKMANKYDAPVTDLPTTFVTVTSNSRTKTVEDYDRAPETLIAFERLIRDTTRVMRWVRIDGPEVHDLFKRRRPPAAEINRLLLEAVRYDDVGVIQALMENGVSPNGSGGEPPLAQAQSPEAARALIAAGADTQLLKKYSLNILTEVPSLHGDLVKILIAPLDNVDLPINGTATALWYAVCTGNIGATTALLDSGASPTVRSDGKSAVECANHTRESERELAKSFPAAIFETRFTKDFDAVIALIERRLKQ
jgi:hypothetical protein